MRRFLAATGVVALALLSAPANAHVTIQPNEAPAGSFFRFVVRVPTERPDAATTKVTVQFPDNLAFVSFQPKEGWKRSVKMRKLDQPVEVSGANIDEVVDTVTWSGGRIAPGEFDEFGFSARVPDDPGSLEFGATQTYDSGEVVEWTGAPDSETPAPHVGVVALEVEEGQGELAALAELQQELGAMGDRGAAATDDDGEGADDGNLGVILGGAGAGLGLIALLVALRATRS